MKVKIKKIHPEAVIPKYAKEGDAAMDVHAIYKKITSKFVEYGTGLTFEVPRGHVMLIFPRSSVTNKDLMMKNSVGVLDSGYRGELIIRFSKVGEEDYGIGDRVGQIIILPYPKIELEEVQELSESERGIGGWGSTGN